MFWASSYGAQDDQDFLNKARWITEEYGKEFRADIASMMKKYVTEDVAPAIQKWIVEEYSNKVNEWAENELVTNIKKWVSEDYSESLEKWITEEYSKTVNNWLNEEFGKEIQRWVVEDYSPVLEKWCTEELAGSMLNESRETKLSNIDSILRMVEENQDRKPAYQSRLVNEAVLDTDEPMFVKKMPTDCVAKWSNASDDVKESIRRRAKLYNLTTESAIERFWNSIDFNAVAPAKSIYEGLDDVKDRNEQSLRLELRRFRR